MQRVTQFMEDPPDSIGAHRDTQLPQLTGNVSESFARPQTTATSRVSGRVLAEQVSQGLQEIGRFFSARGRPPPERRTPLD